MSNYSEKIQRGETPGNEDWPEHLKEAHKIARSMTPHAFANYKTEQGKNSYQLLADSVQNFKDQDAQILDLACGDGYLIPYLLPKLGRDGTIIGIDMSEDELDFANKTIIDQRVSFELGTAQDLNLKNHSIDHVVCHMAFMLMLPIEPVVNELRRILKSKGKFTAVIGSRSSTGLMSEIQKTCFQFISSRYPKVREAKSGDTRVNTLEGLNELFSADDGFEQIQSLDDLNLEFNTDPEGIWNLMQNTYFIGMLPPAEKVELKENLISLGKSNSDSTGKVSFQFPMKLFTVQRK